MTRSKKKKRREDPPPKGAPKWVVTFTDMISLLVTFFVLLMTFSSIEEHDRLKVDGFLTRTRGVVKSIGGEHAQDTLDDDYIAATDIRRGAKVPHSRPTESLEQNLEEMGQKQREDEVALDLNDIADGLQITFPPECSFAPGSAEVNEELRSRLDELGRVLQHYPHLVLVEGHTDDAFAPTPGFPDAESLSVARASAAAEVLLAGSEMQPELLQVAGLGSSRERSDPEDESPSARLTDRRVEVRVVALSRTRADHLAVQRRAAQQAGGG